MLVWCVHVVCGFGEIGRVIQIPLGLGMLECLQTRHTRGREGLS